MEEIQLLRPKFTSWRSQLFFCDRQNIWCYVSVFSPFITSLHVSRKVQSTGIGVIATIAFILSVFTFVCFIYLQEVPEPRYARHAGGSFVTTTKAVSTTSYGGETKRNKIPRDLEGEIKYLDFRKSLTLVLGILAGVFLVLFAVLNCRLRGKVRESLGIDGHEGQDMIVTCFCLPCSLCQMEQEIEFRNLDTDSSWHSAQDIIDFYRYF